MASTIYSREFQRVSAYALMILFFIEFITGIGASPSTSGLVNKLTFGLLNRIISTEIHVAIAIPLTYFFILHMFIGLRNILLSKGINNQFLYKIIFPIISNVLFGIAVYLLLSFF
ncbi:hypothetical protein [Saccharolobus caldissimus]|jgi:succinate dehydrogenase hydrophobic anchor subunit|uniref:Uncharacterized protein n=1 Tax=Saccharolobus caldissimus TaxID=1702097 RepID=A0AAQ4CU96_9CREN|nr:hypothetical protein [Saccharolobus caldissimus]BDB99377.1 hypothetical protein SACC_23940 [Saccharolobus caldissimus]